MEEWLTERLPKYLLIIVAALMIFEAGVQIGIREGRDTAQEDICD